MVHDLLHFCKLKIRILEENYRNAFCGVGSVLADPLRVNTSQQEYRDADEPITSAAIALVGVTDAEEDGVGVFGREPIQLPPGIEADGTDGREIPDAYSDAALHL